MWVDGPTETPFRFPLIPRKTDEVSEAEQEELAERLPFLRPKLHQTAGVSVTVSILSRTCMEVTANSKGVHLEFRHGGGALDRREDQPGSGGLAA
jgi:hypothetical protein